MTMLFRHGLSMTRSFLCVKPLRGLANRDHVSIRTLTSRRPAGAALLASCLLLWALLLRNDSHMRQAQIASNSWPLVLSAGLARLKDVLEDGEHFVSPRDIWLGSPYEQDLFPYPPSQGVGSDTVIRFPHHTELQPLSVPASPGVEMPNTGTLIYCKTAGCVREFQSRNKYNHHKRYHEKPQKCFQCDRRFGTVTHLERHKNDVHYKKKKYFCSIKGCRYAKEGDQKRFFTRKDNWRQHMQTKHGIED